LRSETCCWRAAASLARAVQANEALAVNPNDADAYVLLMGIEAEAGQQRRGAEGHPARDWRSIPIARSFHTALALLEVLTPGNEPEAEQELNKAASLDPKSPTPHLMLAELLERKSDHAGCGAAVQCRNRQSPPRTCSRAARWPGCICAPGDKARAEQTLLEAIEAIPDNEPASALLAEFYVKTQQTDREEPVFANLVSRFPKSFAIKMTYAQILFDEKNYTKSSAIASELTKSSPHDPQLQTLNALLLLNTNKIDDALALLQKATKDDPNNFQIQLLLARVQDAKGDMAGAETTYQNALKLVPGNTDAETGLVNIAIRSNDANLLINEADKTIQAHPEFAPAYLWRGIAEAARREFDKAEADFQTVLTKTPDNPNAYFELAELRFAEKRIPEGKALMEKALDKDPNQIRALAILDALDLQAKQPAKALARAQEQIAKSPNNGALYDQLARIQLATNDAKDAAMNAQKAMSMNGSNSGAVQTYSRAEVAMGNIDPAISTWTSWIAAHPNDSRATEILGSLDEAKGDEPKAMDEYKKALAIDPNNGEAANNLAYLMMENNDNVDVALSLAQTARRVLPDSPQTADTLAYIYYYKGNYVSARDLLENALKVTPDDASMHLHLGMTYAKLNDKPDAQLHLKKAVALAPNSRAGQQASSELAKLG
jgi:tetratricopeptide (TPR) repeat protein